MKSAREYCCAIGMKLANFPTLARMQDAFDTIKYSNHLKKKLILLTNFLNSPAQGCQMLIDETYANGDGTDSWCSTHAQLPVELYSSQTYKHPTIGTWSCCTAWMHVSSFYIDIYEDYSNNPKTSCTNRAFTYPSTMHFLCMP